MHGDSCAGTRRWLAGPGPLAPPEPALAAHVAACPRCRGVLATLLAGLLDAPAPVRPSCEACADDLPVYAELERDEGPGAAAHRYPHVWWHLWTCPDCAALAEDLATLLAAEATGQLAPPPRLARGARPAAPPPLRLARAFLHAVFAPQQALGAVWHSGDDRLVLAEEALDGYRLVVHVRQEGPDHWGLEVTIEPPVDGNLVVSFAETVFRAPLAGGHIARLGGIPAALLVDRTGPDMLLAIEREAGHSGARRP